MLCLFHDHLHRGRQANSQHPHKELWLLYLYQCVNCLTQVLNKSCDKRLGYCFTSYQGLMMNLKDKMCYNNNRVTLIQLWQFHIFNSFLPLSPLYMNIMNWNEYKKNINTSWKYVCLRVQSELYILGLQKVLTSPTFKLCYRQGHLCASDTSNIKHYLQSGFLPNHGHSSLKCRSRIYLPPCSIGRSTQDPQLV